MFESPDKEKIFRNPRRPPPLSIFRKDDKKTITKEKRNYVIFGFEWNKKYVYKLITIECCCTYKLLNNVAVKLFEFQSAVRGYHYYMKYWSPSKSQVLDCMHKADNLYNFFAIKTCEKPTEWTVGYLPMEISRSIKFLL